MSAKALIMAVKAFESLSRNSCFFSLSVFSSSYNKVTVKGAAASHVFFHLKAEAVRMGEKMV